MREKNTIFTTEIEIETIHADGSRECRTENLHTKMLTAEHVRIAHIAHRRGGGEVSHNGAVAIAIDFLSTTK